MEESRTTFCFIDTNIWLYAFIQTDEASKSAIARKLIQESDPIVSTQVINEVCVNLLKLTEFTEEQIRQLIQAFYEKYPVVELDQSILLTASQVRQKYLLSYWDSIIIASALEAEVPILYSEDMQDGVMIEERLRISNPFILV
ncbi:MAG: PIN domain-containing protein [Chloroflexota bacterium]